MTGLLEHLAGGRRCGGHPGLRRPHLRHPTQRLAHAPLLSRSLHPGPGRDPATAPAPRHARGRVPRGLQRGDLLPRRARLALRRGSGRAYCREPGGSRPGVGRGVRRSLIYQPEVAPEATYRAAHHNRREFCRGAFTLQAVSGNVAIMAGPQRRGRRRGAVHRTPRQSVRQRGSARPGARRRGGYARGTRAVRAAVTRPRHNLSPPATRALPAPVRWWVALLVATLSFGGGLAAAQTLPRHATPSVAGGAPPAFVQEYAQAEKLRASGRCDHAIPLYRRAISAYAT